VAGPRSIRIVDIVDRHGFDRLPPCADPRFDHRSCDYWEDDVRGTKAARASWWQDAATAPDPSPRRPDLSGNPFAAPTADADFNPFVPTERSVRFDPFGDGDDEPVDNPFAPRREAPDRDVDGAPRKLALLSRGQGVSGSYAKVLEVDGVPAVYAQFGPLSAYPRARQVRELYPRLPRSPLPAVITCIATAAFARGQGLAQVLVRTVCDDLAGRGFSAVEAYPDLTLAADEASAARPGFWIACGFVVAAEDERFPVMRLELD
jgi:ribosomal protein S18 acetylase RimI-like enzyme